jgi:hypothetical protein
MSSVVLNAQVTIGSGVPPNESALLDLKENNLNSSVRGLLLPRVALVATTNPAPLPGNVHVKGMFVYNTATTATANGVTPGVYYNDGTKWERIAVGDASSGSYNIGTNATLILTGTGTTADPYLLARAAITGDVSVPVGSNTATIERLQGKAISAASPATNQVLQYDGSVWKPVTLDIDDADYIIGNEVKGAANATLVRTGAGTTLDPYLLARNAITGDVSVPVNSNTATIEQLQGKTISAASPATNQVLQYDGSIWKPVTLAAGWLLGGNTDVTATNNILGMTNNQPLIIKVNNTRAGYISNISNPDNPDDPNPHLINYNAIGLGALAVNAGTNNNAFGLNALAANITGHNNSAFGDHALASNKTHNNAAFGFSALRENTEGQANSAFGSNALQNNMMGDQNSAFGDHTLVTNKTGNNNSAFGRNTLYYNAEGSDNSGFGSHVLTKATGSGNSAFGANALQETTVGQMNSAFGNQALVSNTTGNYNVAIGMEAGSILETGSNNILIGYHVEASTQFVNNEVTIGTDGTSNVGTYRIWGGSWTCLSDRRLKHDIRPIGQGLAFVSRLKPVEFVYNTGKGGKELGFIAQDVQDVQQEANMSGYNLVSVMHGDTLGLSYTQLIPVLTRAIQEQQAVIDTQQQAIDALLRRVEALEEKK